MNQPQLVEPQRIRLSGDERRIGTILLDSGKISASEAAQVLRLQQEHGLRFGEAALRLNLITEADIQEVLAAQFDYAIVQPGASGLSPELIAAYAMAGHRVEALRVLRTQLLLRWFSDERKTLAIVSPMRGEGRSVLTANLAIVFAQLGERTLLVDGDLRHPRQHDLFGCSNDGGLSAVLAGRLERVSLAPVPSFPKLALLTAGPVPPNPTELLARDRFTALLPELKERFDVILFDTPHGREFADSQMIAGRAGGAVMVARQNHSRVSDQAALAERITRSGAELVGVALSGH